MTTTTIFALVGLAVSLVATGFGLYVGDVSREMWNDRKKRKPS